MAQASAKKLELTGSAEKERVVSVPESNWQGRGREASERRNGIGEDERQPEMARLAARWRRSNLVILITLEKGNHPGEAYVRRGQRKAFYRREKH